MEIQDRFQRALQSLVSALQEDQHVVAAILAGSLSNDVVWKQSDIDLVIVTDERGDSDKHIELVQNEIPVHAQVVTRNRLREKIASAVGGSLTHAMLVNSTLLFTRDPAVGDVYADLIHVGRRDRDLLVLVYGSCLIEYLTKAEKWLLVKNDPLYASVFLTGAIQHLARAVVLLHDEVPLREAIDQAATYEPDLFDVVYRHPTTSTVTHQTVGKAIDLIKSFVITNADTMFAAMVEFLSSTIEAQTADEISRHFERRWAGELDTGIACRWLASQGRIETTTVRTRITSQGRALYDQPAFFVARTQEVLSL